MLLADYPFELRESNGHVLNLLSGMTCCKNPRTPHMHKGAFVVSTRALRPCGFSVSNSRSIDISYLLTTILGSWTNPIDIIPVCIDILHVLSILLFSLNICPRLATRSSIVQLQNDAILLQVNITIISQRPLVRNSIVSKQCAGRHGERQVWG